MRRRGIRRIVGGHEVADYKLVPRVGYPEFDSKAEQFEADNVALNEAEAALAAAINHEAEVREEWPKMLHRAKIAGQKKPTDPLPAAQADIEAKQVAVEVAALQVVATDAELEQIRTSDEFQRYVVVGADKAIARSVDEAREFRQILNDQDAALRARAWAKYGYAKFYPGRCHEPLTQIERELEALESGRGVVFVDPANYRLLQEGKDAVTTDNRPLSFEDAEQLHKVKRLRVRHGVPLVVGRPS
jgi:hypothetical protein